MLPRLVFSGVLLTALLGASGIASPRPLPAARERPEVRQSVERWVSLVVTKVTRAGEGRFPGDPRVNPGGTVTIRVRIGADGTLEGAAIDQSSGSDALDTRALAAAKAASPFTPPPEKLLTLEGFTELAFPVEFGPAGE
ncbi:cell envelope integrity protein TolA [Methylobacterium brachythecii]|uniref:TonB family protein n=1 Tax=Methylobacterium brachythecii TaxID=1176177 RepID=A0A7W6ALF8_9HYPH|nr:cell envelope integrity protein TolA [Methylobacterium brachythecii]MBB3905622.1 TonB family protein [Methylobacterium brachythecii]GLS46951.1 hypothetical protein GCM10007884_49510 [Methylobacterium brachythecii]